MKWFGLGDGYMSKKRLIVYGDLHGCLKEFKELRKKIKPKKKDIEVVVGDAIIKGPFSSKILSYIRKKGIKLILGNNEDKFLNCINKKENCSDRFWSFAKDIKKKDIEFLKTLPYFLKMKNITIVHGGIPLGVSLDKKLTKKELKELTLLRYYDKDLNSLSWKDKDKMYKYWGELYDGREGFVVYGHQPFSKPRIDKYAIGIDTGCVYGGRLSAVIFKLKNKKYDTKNFKIVSVKARKKYFK